jgi:hypothetical protein
MHNIINQSLSPWRAQQLAHDGSMLYAFGMLPQKPRIKGESQDENLSHA